MSARRNEAQVRRDALGGKDLLRLFGGFPNDKRAIAPIAAAIEDIDPEELRGIVVIATC